MSPIACVILAFGAVGHVVLWVALVNRTHALGIQRRWVDLITAFSAIVLAAVPLLIVAILAGFIPAESGPLSSVAARIVWTYLLMCAAVLVVAILNRWSWSRNPERQGSLVSHHTSVIRLADSHLLLSPGIPSWLGRLPGNEVLKLCVDEKTIAIPRLSPSKEPLR